jgi:hypothetical protein
MRGISENSRKEDVKHMYFEKAGEQEVKGTIFMW